MSLDYTAITNALKTYYPTQVVEDLTNQGNPLYAELKKDKNFGGEGTKIPVEVSNPQGVSATFSVAQARAIATASVFRAWDLGAGKDKYGIARISKKAIEGSRSDNLAFTRALASQISGIMNQTARNVSLNLYRAGWGKVGVVAAAAEQPSFAVTTLKLANTEDINNFELGQLLVVAAAEDTGALRAVGANGGLEVAGIDQATGTLSFAANVNDAANIQLIANGDTIFIKGDREDAASPTKLCVSGLEAWIPQTKPSGSDSFMGVNRSISSRLYGQYYDYTTWNLEDALYDADNKVHQWGGKLSHFFMHPSKFAQLQRSLMSKVQYPVTDAKATAAVGFSTVTIVGMNGPIKIISDRNCPVNKCFGLQMDKWKLYTMGEPIHMDTQVNGEWAVSDADQVEVRVKMYGELCCVAPGWNIHMSI